MPASFPSSFVRSSSTESLSTAAETAMGVVLPPWLRPHQDCDALPLSLYPILPPPVPSIQAHPNATFRSSSNAGIDNDTIMIDAYHDNSESEDLDGVPLEAHHPSFDDLTFQRGATTSYLERREDSISEFQDDEDHDSRLDNESEEGTTTIVKPARRVSAKEKKAALKAADAINRLSKKTSVKNTKSQKGPKKAPASGSQNAPARLTRSSTRAQPAANQPATTQSVDEIVPPTEKNKIRKTWLPWERDLLRLALVSWWTAEGAARFNHPAKMVLPDQKDVRSWEWIRARCKALNGSFNRVRGGVYIVARSMKDDDDLPPVSVRDDSTAGLRRHK